MSQPIETNHLGEVKPGQHYFIRPFPTFRPIKVEVIQIDREKKLISVSDGNTCDDFSWELWEKMQPSFVYHPYGNN